jgi:phosphoribosylglycinamide formyltransferase 1
MTGGRALPLAVLVSGNGSNLQALLDAARAGEIAVEPRVVVSDRADAFALERAARAGVETRVVAPAAGMPRAAYDDALGEVLDTFGVELTALAGFMRVLGPAFVDRHAGRLLNIHPALLPAYRGLHTHRRALADGARVHGASVHFVTETLDGGPVVVQARVPVRDGDDEAHLAARVLRVEHRIYPLAVGWYASGRLRMRGGAAWLDGAPLAAPVVYDAAGLLGEDPT